MVPSLPFAQTQEAPALDTSPANLQNIDWDEETPLDTSPANLQNINWDEETAENSEDASPPTRGNALQNIDWDAEESTTTTSAPAVLATVDEATVEQQILRTHWQGSVLFLVYTFGAFLTAYLLRNSGVASRFPPDLLMLLHVLWPLEWMLVLFFKEPSSGD